MNTRLALIGSLFFAGFAYATPSSVTLLSPGNQTIQLNTTLTITAQASDADGDMTEHNLDIQRPDGQWNWEGGWSTQWPFQGGVSGSGFSSYKSTSFTFDQPGVWHVRSAAADSEGWWHSETVTITVLNSVQLVHDSSTHAGSSFTGIEVGLAGWNFQIPYGATLRITYDAGVYHVGTPTGGTQYYMKLQVYDYATATITSSYAVPIQQGGSATIQVPSNCNVGFIIYGYGTYSPSGYSEVRLSNISIYRTL